MFPAPQPGEAGETGSRCRERQKEGRSKGSRKIIIIKNHQTNKNQPTTHCFTLLCKAVHLGNNMSLHPHPTSFSLGIYNCLRVIFLQHSSAAALKQSYKKTSKNPASSFAFCLRKMYICRKRIRIGGSGIFMSALIF